MTSDKVAEPAAPAAKINVPALPTNLVVRSRLHERLTGGTASRLTLVSAQPGAGKTLLVASWAASGLAPGPVAWVGLDAGDDGPGTFWRLAAAALRQAAGLEIDLSRPGDAPVAVAGAVAGRGSPLVLVLDDFQELRSPRLLGQVETLLARASPELRLVIATRSDPHLSIHRLRLEGTLTEIRAADLAFTVDETRALLGGSGAGLDDADLAFLVDRTEGWAAGLRLAALSMLPDVDPRRFLDDFAGSDRAVADYLMGEVLDRQAQDVREFLLRTSLPDVLTVDLATTLTGRMDSARLLDDLARANAFVLPQRGDDEAFRYHQLFREFLRAELRRAYPDELPVLQRTAASWLASHGEPLLAIEHAIAGGDWEQAADLVARHWRAVVVVRGPTFVRRLTRSLPADAVEQVPELGLLAAVDLLNHGDPEGARRALDRATELPERGRDPERGPGFQALLSLVRLELAQLVGDFDGVRHGAEGHVAERPGSPRHRPVRATELAHSASAALAGGDLEAAEERFEEALDLARESTIDRQVVSSLGGLAFVAAARGRLRHAAGLATDALGQADAAGLSDTLGTFGSRFALGLVNLHWDQLDLAAAHVERAGEVARAHGHLPGRALWGVLASRLLGAAGPAGAAEGLRRLRSAREDLEALRRAPFLSSFAWGLEARLLVARGEGPEAALAALDREEAADQPQVAVVAARVLLLAGRPEEAIARLAGVSSPPYPVQTGALVESLTLRSLAHQDAGRSDLALAALQEALELAAPEAFRREFVEGGPPLAALLRQHLRSGTAHRVYAAELLAAFDRRAPAVDPSPPGLVEPLSERERAVLRYLPTMMSNDEIARALCLSVNTVKTHLRHLYGKLGASSRREAVEHGRRMELL